MSDYVSFRKSSNLIDLAKRIIRRNSALGSSSTYTTGVTNPGTVTFVGEELPLPRAGGQTLLEIPITWTPVVAAEKVLISVILKLTLRVGYTDPAAEPRQIIISDTVSAAPSGYNRNVWVGGNTFVASTTQELAIFLTVPSVANTGNYLHKLKFEVVDPITYVSDLAVQYTAASAIVYETPN